MSTRDERIIATAALLGASPAYFDYGHPERAGARMYWTITDEHGVVHGSTRAICAWKWLTRRGVEPPK